MLNEGRTSSTEVIGSQEIISVCVWLYFQFGVSSRDVEEMMTARGVLLTYETVWRWCNKFGQEYTDRLRRRRARTGDTWHLDEFFLKINGVTHYLEYSNRNACPRLIQLGWRSYEISSIHPQPLLCPA